MCKTKQKAFQCYKSKAVVADGGRYDSVGLISASTPTGCTGKLIREADRWQEVCAAGWRQSYLGAEKDCSRPRFLTQRREEQRRETIGGRDIPSTCESSVAFSFHVSDSCRGHTSWSCQTVQCLVGALCCGDVYGLSTFIYQAAEVLSDSALVTQVLFCFVLFSRRIRKK